MDSPTYSILYIEDNEANRKLVQLILEQKKHLSLICAVDGQSGIQAARSQLPDLILLDISLPDMTGYAVLTALKQDPVTKNVPVVAISGDSGTTYPQDYPFSFNKYLNKPISLNPLYSAIDEFLQP
jgi:CheY-like chemotaxis protein